MFKRMMLLIGALVSAAGFAVGIWLLREATTASSYSPNELLAITGKLMALFSVPSFISLLTYSILIHKKGNKPGNHSAQLPYVIITIATMVTFLNVITVTSLEVSPRISLFYVPLAIIGIIVLIRLADSFDADSCEQNESNNLYRMLNVLTTISVLICLISFVYFKLFLKNYLLIPIAIYALVPIVVSLRYRVYRPNLASFLVLWASLGNIIIGASISMVAGLVYAPIIVLLIVTGIISLYQNSL
ncbi:MAG: hypothetical protein QME41_02070 [Actinomycetota bacterium]|nr:hypothetical protein [Actinomycetota bacterium]